MATGAATGLFTDLYEFTMVQSYLEHSMTGEAVFDLHVRSLPAGRGYLVAAGLASALDALERFSFGDEDVAFLAEQGLSDDLLDHLASFRFDGTVRAVPEGRLVFPHEPIIEVRAPLPTAQLVEMVLLNAVHVETVLATKAARCFYAAANAGRDERPTLVDFGARRAHGPDAAMAAARCAYIAGFTGTSLVAAARRYGIPCFGTMAHSYVQAHPDERAALEAFASSFPDATTLLIDTYDTERGAEVVVDVARALAGRGGRVGGVRLDSGDLAALSRRVRGILDDAGLADVRIFASGGLDEYALAELVAGGAPIDGFGVGTAMVVSDDAPSLDLSYKLVEYDGEPVTKTSPDKHVLPGSKQVYRRTGADGTLVDDTIGGPDEGLDGDPLLIEVDAGPGPRDAAAAARARFIDEFARLPDAYKALHGPPEYPVARSPRIEAGLKRALGRAGAD